MKHWTLRVGVTLVSVLATLTSGPSSSAGAASTPKVGGHLTFEISQEPATLDPVNLTLGGSGSFDAVYLAVFGVLVVDDISSKSVKPFLAESFKTSDQGKTWVLKLRSNLKFSDGTALDASAVKFNWDRNTDASTGSQFLSMSKTLSYTVNDPSTITITLNDANTLFDRVFAQSAGYNLLGSPKALTELKKGFGLAPIGAGPFVLTEWIHANHFTFQRNPRYFDKPRPYLDSLTVMTVTQEDIRWNTFEAGSADLMWTSRQRDVDAARQNSEMRVTLFDQIGWQGYVFNMAMSPVNDVDVRRALKLATNHRQVAAAGLPGSPPASGVFNKGTPFYPGPFYPQTPDLAGAQKLIDRYLQRSGNKDVNLQITYTPNAYGLNTSQVLKAQWERLKGVSVTLTAASGSLTRGTTPMIGAAIVVGCCAPDPYTYNRYISGGTANTTNYSNPDVDAAFAKARSTTDPKVRNEQWRKVGQLMTKDVAVLPLAEYRPDGWVSNKSVRGITGWANAAIRPDLLYVAKS